MHIMGLGPVFWAAEHVPPLCQPATSIQCVKYGNTYTGKSFCWPRGRGGGRGDEFLKKCFLISIYVNVN